MRAPRWRGLKTCRNTIETRIASLLPCGEMRARPRSLTLRWSDYELLSMWARSSATEANRTVPSGSLASIDPSV